MKLIVTKEDFLPFLKYQTPQQRMVFNDTRTSHLSDDMVAENMQVLERCRMYYNGLSDFRERRRRAFNYYRGKQWSDKMQDENGNTVTEEDYIKERGKIPFKQNVIRQLIKNVLGQMLSEKGKSTVTARVSDSAALSEMLTNTLQSIQALNETEIIDVRLFEEFLLSGLAVTKETYSYWDTKDKEDVYTENINNNFVFFNTDIKDHRGLDLRLIGEIKDVMLDDVVATFATNEEEAEKIRGWYAGVNPRNVVAGTGTMNQDQYENIDFYIPTDVNKARVIEVWEKVTDWRTYAHDYMTGDYTVTKLSLEDIAAANEMRISQGVEAGMKPEEVPLIDARRKMESFWVVKYLTPYGQCLFQSETPYKHQSHPYTMTAYPLIDGEIWGMVEDVIDQQRGINRWFSLVDSVIGSSSKGVLIVPEDSIPEDMDIDDIADEWSKVDGVIKLKLKPGAQIPQQLNSNMTNVNVIMKLVEFSLDEIQKLAGVSDAIQGQRPASGTPNSLYQSQAAYSTTNLKDVLNAIDSHFKNRDEKMLKLAIQFYKEKRYIATSGKSYAKEAEYYDPELVKDLDVEMVINKGTDTPVYRQAISEQLFQLLGANKIDLKMYLENSGIPYADKLLAQLEQREKEAQKQQAAQQQQIQQPQMPQQ